MAVYPVRHALLLEITPAHTRGNPQLVICDISGEFVVQTTAKSPGSFRIRVVKETDAIVKKESTNRVVSNNPDIRGVITALNGDTKNLFQTRPRTPKFRTALATDCTASVSR
jgi:hypothetical protein